MTDKNDRRAVMWMIIYIISAVAIALVFCGCKTTKYIPVETVKTVYQNTTDTIRDSIKHEVYVNQYIKGDTVYKDRIEYLYKDRWKVHDSIVLKTDSIPYPVEVIKEVQKPIPLWHFAVVGMALLICVWQIKKIVRP